MRICSGPGCSRAVPDDVRFCDECKPTPTDTDGIKVHTSGYTDKLDRLRKGTKWQKRRLFVIKRDPFCKRCGIAVSAEVDHIVPAHVAIAQAQVSGRWPFDKNAGYYLLSNLQGLCRKCHATKTIEDKAHVGPWPNVVVAYDAAPKKKWTFV